MPTNASDMAEQAGDSTSLVVARAGLIACGVVHLLIGWLAVASGAHRDRSLAARATSSLPRTGSDDEQNDRDDDGNDEGGDGDRAGAHGVSEPVGINWRPYSVSPIVSILLTA